MDSPTSDQAATFARLFGSWGKSAAAPAPRPLAPQPGSATLPVRAVAAAMQAANANVLLSGGVEQLQDQVHAILAAAQRRSLQEFAAGPVAIDGGVPIDSMSAVFVCGVVDRVLGGGVLSKLARHSRPTDFVSTRALSSLLVRLRSRKAA